MRAAAPHSHPRRSAPSTNHDTTSRAVEFAPRSLSRTGKNGNEFTRDLSEQRHLLKTAEPMINAVASILHRLVTHNDEVSSEQLHCSDTGLLARI